ncbi:hypothetical protein BCR32DRAFT_271286 [Anaeromyces robustus]|jgi:hypothetical protein|uniref:Zinc finger CCCH domain-containing protein 14 n=1 Tax=Anaeromyces robustus TaxID=1754192 RepID=A0A1Y1WSH5_9FUNG|nr:hypothetical protein BCR32DRAFT_271286 [Anaeromyces robustus]|eukprot:ORX76402.1 hypothetical protein BCR32DRAFT_271286 [Anaeromyces robustus]
MTEVSVDIPSVMNSKQKFNQRLVTSITNRLNNLKINSTPKDVTKIVNLLNEGKNKTQLTEEITTIFADDKDKIKNSFIDWLIGYSNVCCTPTVQEDNTIEELKSPSVKSEKAGSIKEKAENKSKSKRRVSQSSRISRRSIIEGTPISPPPSPPKSSRASSVSSSDYEKSQKNIYHQRRLSRSANTLDLTSQVQNEIMAQTLALAAAADLKKDKEIVKRERRRSVRSIHSTRSRKSSFSSVKEEDTSRIRCQYWPTCNRGDQCKFWHPKELCKKFPNCPNGDNCLYIHPAVSANPPAKPQSPYRRISQSSNSPPDLSGDRVAVECKYGANCTRADCKFSHPSPAAKLTKQQNTTTQDSNKNSKSNVPCHYYPNCKNADCPYMHPTAAPKNETVNVACRYGSSCTRQDCHFLHPSSRRV